MIRRPRSSPLFPSTTLFRSGFDVVHVHEPVVPVVGWDVLCSAGELPLVGTFHTYSENPLTNGIAAVGLGDRKSTRLNSSHSQISYAVFCLKKKISCYIAITM